MEIKNVAVLGAGTMGAGIAQVCAQVGCSVALFDINDEATGRGIAGIEKFLSKGVEKGKVTEEDRAATLDRIRTTTDLKDAASGIDLVIEAAPEDLALKRLLALPEWPISRITGLTATVMTIFWSAALPKLFSEVLTYAVDKA